MNNKLTISLTKRELLKLNELYVELLTTWKPEGDIEQLLFDHALELEQVMRVKIAQEVQRPKLVLNKSQARAFWMLWQLASVTGDQDQERVMNSVFEGADKYIGQPDAQLLKLQNEQVLKGQ